MPLFIQPTNSSPVSIAICDRCKMKVLLTSLIEDPNAPGLRVCERGCVDQFDPWRLPARVTENIVVQYPRPEEPLEA